MASWTVGRLGPWTLFVSRSAGARPDPNLASPPFARTREFRSARSRLSRRGADSLEALRGELSRLSIRIDEQWGTRGRIGGRMVARSRVAGTIAMNSTGSRSPRSSRASEAHRTVS
jgi:hypothetical protein